MRSARLYALLSRNCQRALTRQPRQIVRPVAASGFHSSLTDARIFDPSSPDMGKEKLGFVLKTPKGTKDCRLPR